MARRKQRDTRKLALLVWVLAGVVVLQVGSLVFGRQGLLQASALNNRLERLSAEASLRIARNDSLNQDFQGLRHDPRVLEAVARQKLGVVAGDEFLFRFSHSP
ncbi:MAG: septum formation initiator family protein [Proteobacteria bacterium]|nr:septum formation initiator family protein [Pseudomonadota bacterium]